MPWQGGHEEKSVEVERAGSRAGEDSPSPLEAKGAFHAAFMELEAAVRSACGRQAEWPGKIAGGVGAALEFAAGHPAAAAALTLEAGTFRAGPDGLRHPELIERYAALLGSVAPNGDQPTASTNEGVIATIVSVVVIHVKCRTTERLREATPDLIHLTLLPYTGFAEAQRWAERVAPPPTSPS